MITRDRIYYPKKFKQFNQALTNHEIKILGLDNLSKLDLFKIAVAYGLDDPKDFDGTKEVLFLLKDIKSTFDQSLFGIIKLGTADNNDEIDEYCDLELNYDEAERCANSGFEKLKVLVESNPDEELLIKKMIKDLEKLYLLNVKFGK